MFLTTAAEAKWVMEDEVEQRRKALQDAVDHLNALNNNLNHFVSAAKAKGIDTDPYTRRRDICWLPQLSAS